MDFDHSTQVDEIKKNREERRAKQAEALAQKQEMTKHSSNNKNWEFGNMIKCVAMTFYDYHSINLLWHEHLLRLLCLSAGNTASS